MHIYLVINFKVFIDNSLITNGAVCKSCK